VKPSKTGFSYTNFSSVLNMTSNRGIKTTKDNAEKTAYKILKKIFRNANLL
jgi:hypothetical protein